MKTSKNVGDAWLRLFVVRVTSFKSVIYGILRPAFGVNILHFVLFPDHKNIQATSLFQEQTTRDLLQSAMELHFIEIPKLAFSREKRLQTRFEKWLNVLKNGERFGTGKESFDELAPENNDISVYIIL